MPTTLLDLQDWRFTVDFEGIAWAVMDRRGESMNSLGRRAAEELGDSVMAVEQAAVAEEVKGLVIMSAKDRSFIAGADIREFGTPKAGTQPHLGTVIHTVEFSDKPVIAAISGVCMGGGLELALGCHYRVAAAGAKIALPEVKLGLLPGAGGTQRLPQLIGPARAKDLIFSGRFVGAAEALAIGLADQVVPDGQVYEAACALAARYATGPPIA